MSSLQAEYESKLWGHSENITLFIMRSGNNNDTLSKIVKSKNLNVLEFLIEADKVTVNSDLKISVRYQTYSNGGIVKIFSKALKYRKELLPSPDISQWYSLNSPTIYSTINSTIHSTIQNCNYNSSKIALNVYNYKVDINITVKDSTFELCTKLFSDEAYTDFELLGEDGGVMVHRMCLGMQSPVLAAMLDGDWKEAKAGRVELKGVTKETLNHLKAYIYLKKLPTVVSALQQLLELARYFIMSGLVEDCLEKIAEIISEDHIQPLLEFAFMFDNVPKLQ